VLGVSPQKTVFISSRCYRNSRRYSPENCIFYQTTRRSISEGVAVLEETLADRSATTLPLHMLTFPNVAFVISGNLERVPHEKGCCLFVCTLAEYLHIEENLSCDILYTESMLKGYYRSKGRGGQGCEVGVGVRRNCRWSRRR
jgi:hypothetical protein